MMYAKLVNDSVGGNTLDFAGGLFDVYDESGKLIASDLTQRQVGELARQCGERAEPHQEDIASGRVSPRARA